MYQIALALCALIFLGCSSESSTLSVECGLSQLADGTTVDCGGNNAAVNGDGSANAVDAGASSDSALSVICPVPFAIGDGWTRSNGSVTRLPNFVIESDGMQWQTSFEAWLIPKNASISVNVSQEGPDAPAAPAVLSFATYDQEGASIVANVSDVPSPERHALSIMVQWEPSATDLAIATLSAPFAKPLEDAALWVWSTVIVTPHCD